MKKILKGAAALMLLALAFGCAQAEPESPDGIKPVNRLADECVSGFKREFPAGARSMPSGGKAYGMLYRANISYNYTVRRNPVLNFIMGPEVTDGQRLCYIAVDVNGKSAIGFHDAEEAYYFETGNLAQSVQTFFESSFKGYSMNKRELTIESHMVSAREFLARPLGATSGFGPINWPAMALAGATVAPAVPVATAPPSVAPAPTPAVVAPAAAAPVVASPAAASLSALAMPGGHSAAEVTQAFVNRGIAGFIVQNSFTYPKAQALFMEWAVACTDGDTVALEGVNAKFARLNQNEKGEFEANIRKLMQEK